ncbi:hypothetical protein HII17_15725 [Thalassotalea sp. M1531]|uniref:histidine kinase n=1 Tax=Thalassotalea algicola TaxID=2716224 RepID=A0A7Y0LEW9_9GAMM|nr:CHASE domain-containing protein [Thalassotalea algicola]NMP33008.1 hypothetical protein [Thalassotalea algicola]
MIKATDMFTSLVSFVIVITVVNFSLSPFSLLNFFGAIAGASSALVVLKGPRMLLSILLNLLGIHLVAAYYFNVVFNAEYVAIGLLAIMLQSVWTAQLTSDEMKDVGWLSSREKLSRFLIKLGPLSGLVSASAVIILILISNQKVGVGYLYTFVLNWSLSQLVAIFLLPTLLFIGDIPKVSRNKRAQVVIASVLAAIALSILFRVSQNDYQHKRIDDFSLAVNQLTNEIDDEISGISQSINALHAYFDASEYVSRAEFEQFASQIYPEHSSVIAFAWVPVIQKNQKVSFEDWARIDNSESFNIKQLGVGPYTPSKEEQISFHAPIYYAYPTIENQQAIGLDLVTDRARYMAMFNAAKKNQTVSSPPIPLIDQAVTSPGMVIFTPIFNASSLNPFGGIALGGNDNLDGFVIAVIQLKEVIDELIKSPVANKVTINVQDVTNPEPFYLYGVPAPTGEHLIHTIERFEFSRFWRITISERTSWVAQPRNWLNWGVLIGCTLGGILYQLLILLMTAYSSELNQKVSDKTKELILQKEDSEKQNKAKSQFLINLSNELKTPISALSGLLIQLNESAKNDKYSGLIEKINSVSSNLKQSIDTLSDLSEIESGKLEFQQHGFDFHLFLQQLETMLNVSTDLLLVNVRFQFDESVPHYVTGDKLRIQQLIVALVHNGALIFNNNKLSLTVNAHRHQRGTVTIFLVITPDKEELDAKTIPNMVVEQEFDNLTTSMTMAKEICQRLGGAINLAPIAETGDYMLSASFKLKLDDSAQQLTYPLDNSLVELSDKHVVIISDDETSNDIISRYFSKFGCELYVYEVINEKVLNEITLHQCDLIFIACFSANENGFWLIDKIKSINEISQVPIVGVAPQFMSAEQLNIIQSGLDFYISKPIKLSALTQIVHQYLS